MIELWKSVPEHPTYLVSSKGNLKRASFMRTNSKGELVTYKEKPLKPSPSTVYYRIDYWKDGKKNGYDYVHRIVYRLFIDEIPEGLVIDHINGNGQDNNITNLRCVSRSQNSWNLRFAKGYSYHKDWKLYFSTIMAKGQLYHLGYYKTEKEARMAYVRGVLKYHQGFHDQKITPEEIKEAVSFSNK